MNYPTKLALTGCLAALLASCTGVVVPGPGAADTGDAGGGSAGSTSNSDGGVGAVPVDGVLPARVRRLTNAEYDQSVQALLGTSKTPGQGFAPDTRQGGFTVNAAQMVDPVLIGQLQGAADDLAHEVVTMRLSSLGGCAAGDDCARQIITSFGSKAYRRPITTDESADLFTIYQLASSDGGTFADGIERVVAAVLQSASFLYVTEIGDKAGASDVTLNDYEVASSLSYLFLGAPPDGPLLEAARAGTLGDPAERERQARRLLSDPRAVAQRARLIKEWLGLDKLGSLDKTYQDFQKFRPMMEQETNAFIERAFGGAGAGLHDLLTSEANVAPAELASSLYGGKPRRGILNQATFLSVYGKANETDPVHRGVVVWRRLICDDIPSPATLNIKVVPPAPDTSKTTRERFSIHSADAACSACHKRIDAVGFTFENFDGMGRVRTQDNNKPVNTVTDLAANTVLDGHYDDSSALITRLAESPEVAACFAKHAYHFASAQSFEGMDAKMAEAWKSLPATQQGSLSETLVAYAKSSIFTTRKVQP